MTTFIEQEATRVAERILDNPPVPSGPCPSFFRCLCVEATAGGQNSYKTAAYELTQHVGRLVDETDAVDDLIALVDSGDDAGVLGWFETHLPRCLAMVPQRRRDQFVQGVYAFEDDHGIAE
jgi:hypothetical protein